MNEWISVKDRLPEEGVIVLALLGESYEKEAHYHPLGWRDHVGTWMDDVTHWQPLPQPPEQESDDDDR